MKSTPWECQRIIWFLYKLSYQTHQILQLDYFHIWTPRLKWGRKNPIEPECGESGFVEQKRHVFHFFSSRVQIEEAVCWDLCTVYWCGSFLLSICEIASIVSVLSLLTLFNLKLGPTRIQRRPRIIWMKTVAPRKHKTVGSNRKLTSAQIWKLKAHFSIRKQE